MPNVLHGLLACALLAGCARVGTGGFFPGAAGARHPWTVPGVLGIGSQVSPNTLDPLLAANTTENMIDRLIFDVLISTDASGRRDVPMLAATVPTLENGGISRDGLTLTYYSRNVRWSDGVPFTSKDVKFSWSAILNPHNNVISQTGYSLVRSVDTPDPWTVVFHMRKKFSPAIDTLFAESDSPYNVVPEHILGKLTDINNVAFNSASVGTGPFLFKEWARGDHLTLVANPHYYLGAPKLKEIIIKFIPDENTELSALRTHDLKALPGVRLVLQDRNEYERIQINTLHPPLDDVRVRQAIAYALNLSASSPT